MKEINWLERWIQLHSDTNIQRNVLLSFKISLVFIFFLVLYNCDFKTKMHWVEFLTKFYFQSLSRSTWKYVLYMYRIKSEKLNKKWKQKRRKYVWNKNDKIQKLNKWHFAWFLSRFHRLKHVSWIASNENWVAFDTYTFHFQNNKV